MNRQGPVVVRKGGFLSAFVYGFFGTLTALIVCAGGVGAYAISVADHRADAILHLGGGIIHSLPELREALPPVLADTLNDRRAPDYREALDLKTRIVPAADGRPELLIINATNQGKETVTLLNARIVLVDERDVPHRALNTYVATPAALDNDWRGPILPGATRRCALNLHRTPNGWSPKLEITDLRVWNADAAKPPWRIAPPSPTKKL